MAGVLALCFQACHVPKTGDLLFHVTVHENSITAVTPAMIDHVAVCVGGETVIEALPRQGVVLTPIDSLLCREEGYYIVGRVKGACPSASIDNARQLLGQPYDSLYLPDNGAIYCSELVLLSFVDRHGHRLLSPVPMSFRDSSGCIPDYWQQLYRRHQMDVPEGTPGSNPAELSKRVKIKGTLR